MGPPPPLPPLTIRPTEAALAATLRQPLPSLYVQLCLPATSTHIGHLAERVVIHFTHLRCRSLPLRPPAVSSTGQIGADRSPSCPCREAASPPGTLLPQAWHREWERWRRRCWSEPPPRSHFHLGFRLGQSSAPPRMAHHRRLQRVPSILWHQGCPSTDQKRGPVLAYLRPCLEPGHGRLLRHPGHALSLGPYPALGHCHRRRHGPPIPATQTNKESSSVHHSRKNRAEKQIISLLGMILLRPWSASHPHQSHYPPSPWLF